MSVQVADLVANLRSSDEGFSHSMDVAGRAVEGLHHNTDSALGSIKALGLGLGALSAGALVSAVKAASDYSTMLIHVQSNSGATNAEMTAMSAGIKALSASSGAPLEQLSEGWMRVHNSGFSAADALKILQPAMESALSTGDDTGKVAQALGTAMHEFGLKASQAAVTMNILHTAAALGNSTLGEFADGTTKALNLAGGFGVKLVDVAGALATLTQSGQTARMASDGLASVMSGIVKPTDAAKAAIQNLTNETGVNLTRDFSAAGLKSQGLVNIIDDVRLAVNKMGGETAIQRKTMSDYADQLTATGNISDKDFTAKMTKMATSIHDPTAALISMFPNIRAFREMMLFTGSQADSLAKNMGALGAVVRGDADPTAKGYADQQASLAGQLQKVQANVTLVAIAIGDVLLPTVTKIATAVANLTPRFNDWIQEHKGLVVNVLLAGAALGGLTVAAMALGPAIAVATGPIGILAAAGVGLYEAWQHNFGGIQGIVQSAWGGVKPVFDAMGRAIHELQLAFSISAGFGFSNIPAALGLVKDALAPLGSQIKTALAGIDWAGLGQTIARNVLQWGRALVGWIQPQIPGIVAALGDLANRVITYIRAAAPVIEGQMLAWGQAVWSWIQQATPRVVAQLQTWGAALVAWVQPQIGPLVATLGGLLSRLGSWIVGDALPVVVAHLQAWGNAFVAWISPKIGPMVSAAGGLLGRLGSWMQGTALPAIGQHLQAWGQAFVAWIAPHIQPMLTAAGNLLGQFGNWIGSTALPAISAKLVQWGNAFVAWIVPATLRFLNDWPGHLNQFLDVVEAAVPKIVAKLVEWGGAFVNWIQANNVIPKLATAFVAVNLAIIDFIGTTVGVIGERLLKWANAFADWVVPSIKLLGPSLNLFWDALKTWIDNTTKTMVTRMIQFGKDTVQGFIDGVKALAPTAVKALENMAGDALSAVAHKLHIGSPSQVMYQYGQWTVQGYANGVIASAALAWDAAKTVADGTILTWGQTLQAGAVTLRQVVAGVWADVLGSLVAGNTKLGESAGLEITTNMVQSVLGPAGRDLFAETAGKALSTAITTAHQTAAATSLPSVQSAHAGLARAAVAALAGGITSGASTIAQATTAAMSQAAQAARATLNEFALVSAEAAQRLKNLAATGNTSGVVAGQQASAAQHVDQSGITPAVSNADQIRANFAAMTGTTQAVATNTASTASALATSLAMLRDQTILLPDMLKQLTDAKTTQELTTAVQAAHTSLLNQENDARAQGNNALLASLQGQQQALGIQQQVETSLINQVNTAQTLADKANQTLATDQQRLSTLQQQEDAADQALNTARENLQTVQDTLQTQQQQLNLKLAYDPSHAAQQGQLDAMAVDHAKTVLSLDSQIQAAKDGHNSKLVTQLTNQKSLLDTQYSDQRGVLEAQAQQANNAYQAQQTQLSDLQQQQSIANQLKTAQDKVVAAAKKDADATAAVTGQQAVVDAATKAANAATQAWKDAIGNRTKEDNTATARAIQNAVDVQGKVTQGYDLQVKQIADIADKQLKQHNTRMTQLLTENGALGPAGAPTSAAVAAAAGGNAGAIAGAVSQPSVTLQQAIADATKVAPKAMHDYGVLMANLLAAGLAQGLSEQGAITYALSTLSKGMQGQISQDWQMHSPSRVAEAYGRNIVAGLVGGIRASHADARAVLGGLTLGVGGGGAVAGGSVQVTVHVNGDAVTVSGVDHHGLGKAMGDVAKAFLAAARTTAPGASPLAPGGARTVPI